MVGRQSRQRLLNNDGSFNVVRTGLGLLETPGQALAYMIGRLEIQRIRRDAEAALGGAFDIKGFHDTVLGSGLMPLPILDRVVRAWVDDRLKIAQAAPA